MSETSKNNSSQSNEASKSYLRPEPNSLSWEALSDSQRVAFKQIVRSLGQVWARRDDKSVTAFYEQSNSALKRVLWIDGGRGMGKSTLLKSVARAIATRRDWNDEIAALKFNRADCVPAYEDIEHDIVELQGRVVWLDPLELELLPGPTNLLAAILARLEGTWSRICGGKDGEDRVRGLLEPRESRIDPIQSLSTLMANVSLSWDGNAKERAARVDPDIFSREVNRAEKTRMSVPTEFRTVINTIAMTPEWRRHAAIRDNPIFVVSIDDCDLSPERCLEILRLLRMIDSPRLMTIVLGDFKNASEIAQVKFAGDRAQVANIRLDQDVQKSDFFKQQRHLAFEAMRKLVPPNQRIALMPMSSVEVLLYRPDRNERSIAEILDEIPISIPTTGIRYPNPTTHATLFSFLTTFPLSQGSATTATPKEIAYGGLSGYQVPVRVVADLWFKLVRLRDSIRLQGCADPHAVFKVAYSLLEDGVISDSNLSDNEQQCILSSFEARESEQPSWRISPSQTLVSWTGGVSEVTTSEGSLVSQLSFEVSFDGHWSVRPNLPRSENEFEVDGSAKAMFLLTHDMIHLMQRNHAEPSCVSGAKFDQLAATIHDFNPLDPNGKSSRIVIDWPKPDFATFMDWNHFLGVWKEAIRRVDEVRQDAYNPASTRITRLAYWWIVAAVAIYDGHGVELSGNESERDIPGDWLKLGMRVEALASQMAAGAWIDLAPTATERSFYSRVRNWLERMALLLAPESEVSREVVQQFFNGVVEQALWAKANAKRSTITEEEKLAALPKTALYEFWAAEGRSRRIRKQRAAFVTSYRKIVTQSHATQAGEQKGQQQTVGNQARNAPAQHHESQIVKLVELIDSPTDAEKALAEATEALRAFVELCGPTNAGYVPGGREMTVKRLGWIADFQTLRDTPVPLTINEIERMTGHLANHYWALEGRAAESKHAALDELLTKATNALKVAKHAESGHHRQSMNPFERGGVLCPTAEDEEGRPKGTGTGTNS